ncbi:MAG: tail fiber domain-containing protein [Bacteroidia bacterium]|nr:tail fiber domain-containing protein [Bacteroidia bacterium]
MNTKSTFVLFLLLAFGFKMYAQNVGVGTATPASKLDVEGGVSIGSAYSGSVAAPANGAIIEGAVGIGTSAPFGQLHVNNSTWFLAANLQSNSNVGTWLSLGNTDPGGRWFSLISTATNNGEGAGKLIFTRNVAASTTAGTIMALVHATSNVGIGTFSPSARLEVVGNSGDENTFGILRVNTPANGANLRMGVVDGSRSWIQSHGGLPLYVNPLGNNIIMNSGAGSVGVGLTNPLAKFHVMGNTSNVMNVQSSASEADIHYITPTGTWQVGSDAAGNGTSGNQFFIWNGGYRLTVQQGTGNVGVGTTTPNVGLTVIKPAHSTVGLGTGVFITGGAGGSNACMELRGGTSYLDFTNGGAEDYDIRFIRDLDDRLQVQGGQLFVNGSYSGDDFGNTGTFIENFVGTGDLWFASGFNPYSIRANQWVIGNTFACYSDQRIKKEVHKVAGNEALTTLNKIEVNSYKYVDYVQNGPNERIGFIAQQVEEVFPQAVTRLSNFIPDVYQLAKRVAFNKEQSTLTLTMESKVDFKVGDKIQLFIDKEKTPFEAKVSQVSGNTFTLENWTKEAGQVFVYGKEVNDFKGVDYDRVFILGISAIQELDRKTADLNTKVDELEKLKAEVQSMKRDLQELKNK